MKDWRSCVAGMRATSKRFAVSGPKCQCRFSSGLIRCTLRLALDQGKQRSTNTTSAPVLAFRTVTYCTENEETPDRRVRLGARTPQATACKDEQRRLARRARCWWVRSALTCSVNAIEATNANTRAALAMVASGQLPFLG